MKIVLNTLAIGIVVGTIIVVFARINKFTAAQIGTFFSILPKAAFVGLCWGVGSMIFMLALYQVIQMFRGK